MPRSSWPVTFSSWSQPLFETCTYSCGWRSEAVVSSTTCDRSSDCGMDAAAIPRGTSGQSCLSFCDPRPGRHLLQAIGSGSDGPRSESSSNSGSGAQANAVCERLDGSLRRECLDFLIPINERHLKMTVTEWVIHYNRGRPHSSLGPGLPEPNRSEVPASDHRHKMPSGYRVVKTY